MAQLLLAGGGHANALALRALCQRRAGQSITLLSDETHTPYSGMLPGYIAGHYSREQCFINLQHLAAACGAEFVRGQVCGIRGNTLHLADGTHRAFEVLSLNVGATPPPPASAAECAVKPIATFMQWLTEQDTGNLRRLTVVGGGAGGIETTLALAHRWRQRTPAVHLTLATHALLPHGTPAMRRQLRNWLAQCGVTLCEDATATAYDGTHLHLADGRQLPCCRVVYATPVAAPAWFADTHLTRDDAGFLRVHRTLQSPSNAQIFISGDAASHTPPLPKAGVMAVRQGAVLAKNLPIAAHWRQGTLVPAPCTTQALFIVGNGKGSSAVASRNGITLSGRWIWRWKQWLDARFMRKLTA